MPYPHSSENPSNLMDSLKKLIFIALTDGDDLVPDFKMTFCHSIQMGYIDDIGSVDSYKVWVRQFFTELT